MGIRLATRANACASMHGYSCHLMHRFIAEHMQREPMHAPACMAILVISCIVSLQNICNASRCMR